MDNMKEIVEKLNLWAYQYYTLDEPIVSDAEYDKLYDELLKLEKETGIILPNSPTQRVGGEVLEKFEKHTHLKELYSLQKAQSFGELEDFHNRCVKLLNEYNSINNTNKTLEYYVEFKFDGLTINLTYDNGILISASTRGNGVYGEEVFEQVKTIKSIPLEIEYKGLVEIQGEAIMPLSALEKYNETAEVPLKNARNAAAGAIRNLDPRKTAKRNLDAFIYNVGFKSDEQFKTQEEMIAFLKENKFKVNEYEKKCLNINEIIEKINEIDVLRKKVDYLTDGVVIKVNDFELREYFGYTNKFPRFAIAYKFEAEEYSTILKEVVWNVGRTGKVTPTAILEPVEIGDVTVQRATLNNYDDILRKKVKINSRVLIRRSNDVIPEILGTMDEDNANEIEIKMPTHCPFCNSELIRDGVHFFCTNTLACTPQLTSALVHFASKNAMNIEGLSEKTIDALFEKLGVDTVYKIYDLKYDELLEIKDLRNEKEYLCLKSITNNKVIDLKQFLQSTVKGIGKNTSEKIVKLYNCFDDLKNAYDLNKLNISESINKKLYNFFDNEYNDNFIKELVETSKKHNKRIINLLKSIKQSKIVNIENFIYALGIKNVGVKTAKDLAKKYKKLDNLRKATVEELLEINDIGDVVANSIFEFFNDEYSKDALDKLLAKGIEVIPYEEVVQSEFTDKKIVITGTFEKYKRKDLEDIFSQNGLVVQSAVAKSTDFLVVGEKAGSKLKKAQELGIEIITEDVLESFLEKIR
ncbi:NAD-dependent DNA ligase LigA [uncultured Parvimonas sp.]|uniref:NAD-dependent DNA ligase LigA n=1 Tax=uncultured Parvimonas sp. TaxID=747372 RepID=UPI002804B913|nr:NAD-dependent DNA ligase LigA [uncultured Parvimonas sp.]